MVKIDKKRLLKSVRNVLISVVVLLILAVGLGFGYTWYVSQDDSAIAAEEPAAEVKTTANSIKPQAQDPNAKVGVSVQSITSPVNPGANASIYIRTNPGATCKISVVYDKTASKDSGLKDKVTDEYGTTNWTWTVESDVPLGKWPVTVTCGLDEKRYAVVVGDLVVEKASAEK